MQSFDNEENMNIIRLSFLDEKTRGHFLKKETDLYFDVWLEPLDELISLGPNDFDGELLNKNRIPVIVQAIYNELLAFKDDRMKVKNSKVLLFVYTLCKIDDIVLFLVWQIGTRKKIENRTEWEESCSLEPKACCKKNFFSLVLQDPSMMDVGLSLDDIQLQGGSVNSLIKKNCKYKKRHVYCAAFQNVHLLNYQNPKALESFKEIPFLLPINKSFTFGSGLKKQIFHYGGIENTSSLTCDLLYDQIVFENTKQGFREHNFQNFLSDSLYTCFYYQNKNLIYGNKQKIEQRLLHISLYL